MEVGAEPGGGAVAVRQDATVALLHLHSDDGGMGRSGQRHLIGTDEAVVGGDVGQDAAPLGVLQPMGAVQMGGRGVGWDGSLVFW